VTEPTPAVLVPADSVAEEIRVYLREVDATRLGEIFVLHEAGMNAEQIAEELGVSSTSFVWNYKQFWNAMLEGKLPRSTTMAQQTVQRLKKLLKKPYFSPEARLHLEAIRSILEQRAEDTAVQAAEDEEAQQKTLQAESRNQPGVYVYTLPHYLRHPFEPNSGRTLLKVGSSKNDTIIRFKNQTRTTALPEEPLLLRIYTTADTEAASTEKIFHRLLSSADHAKDVERTAGIEWFVTSTKFLDEIATVLSLSITVVYDPTAADT
jgi:DNA-binding transcriptional MerR regulator